MATRNSLIKSTLMAVICVVSLPVFVSAANRPPVIKLSILYSGTEGVLLLKEETPLNSIVGIMETKDEDEGQAGEVDCVLENPYINLSLAYPKTYKIALGKELDRETVNLVNVSILCSDKGTPQMTSAAMFTIEIVDINDNAPTFTKSVYNAHVSEDALVHSPVTKVRATDPDQELNGIVKYFIKNASSVNNPFTIDNETGQIFTIKPLDREQQSDYVLTVIAKDSGNPSLSSTAQVKIQVEDINDNAPVLITKELYIKENLEPMSLVGSLEASDLDHGKNSELVFYKVEDSEASSTAPFIVQQNGNILSIVSLDHEQKRLYTMDVMVKDKGAPRQNSTSTISIHIDDLNDNAPRITSPCLDIDLNNEDSYPSYDYSYDIVHNISSGFPGFITIDWYSPEELRLVHQVEAIDNDSNENGEVHFAIESTTSGNAQNATTITDPLFQIDDRTGQITLRRFVRKNDNLVQILNISVTDKGKPPLAAFCRLNITLNVDVSKLKAPTSSKATKKGLRVGNGAPEVMTIMSLTYTRCSLPSLLFLCSWCCLTCLLFI